MMNEKEEGLLLAFGRLYLPLELKDVLRSKFPEIMRFLDVTHEVPFDTIRGILANPPQGTSGRILAIKEIRTITGWQLKQCKDWLDQHFPPK